MSGRRNVSMSPMARGSSPTAFMRSKSWRHWYVQPGRISFIRSTLHDFLCYCHHADIVACMTVLDRAHGVATVGHVGMMCNSTELSCMYLHLLWKLQTFCNNTCGTTASHSGLLPTPTYWSCPLVSVCIPVTESLSSLDTWNKAARRDGSSLWLHTECKLGSELG